MILIMATRLGVLDDVPQALEKALARADLTVQWNPIALDRPVLCAFGADRRSLCPERPASVRQLLHTIRKAGLNAVVAARLMPHDSRRGGASEIARVSPQLVEPGLADLSVAHILGHGSEAFRRRTTQEYVGALEVDHWRVRLAADLPENGNAPLIAPVPMQRTATTTAVIDCYMDEQAMDKTNKTQRGRAAASDCLCLKHVF
jgi:hypothetical protein